MDVHLGSGSSASLTNIGSGRSVTSVLSFSPLSTPGGLDSMSMVACIFSGTCLMTRLLKTRLKGPLSDRAPRGLQWRE